jgi:hypothetical protein
LAPTKLQNLAVYLINKLDREIGTIEFIKLIYLSDIAHYRIFGRTITGSRYFRYPKGPYTKDFANQVSELEAYEVTRQIKPSRGYSQFPKIAHKKGGNPRFEPSLEPAEREIADQALLMMKDLEPVELEKLAYKTEPMQAIIEREQKSGQILLGEPLDFSLVKRDSYMKKVLENRASNHSATTKEYEAFLKQERKEFTKLLQA